MSESFLEICNITKTFQGERDVTVLSDVSIDVQKDEIVCLLGHSGCGKTTLLRILCGFEKADSGEIYLNSDLRRKPTKDMLMLFQDFNQLLPWKTVQNNIIHAIMVTKTEANKEKAKQVCKEILEEVGLSEFRHAFPCQLSGGMKQRAAFARAIVLRPKVLLMDEPFASLDYNNRIKLQSMTRNLCKKHHITAVCVTHDINEAIALSDKIVVMQANPGCVRTIINDVPVEDKKKMYHQILEHMS